MRPSDAERRQESADKINKLRHDEKEAAKIGNFENLYRTDRDAQDYDFLFRGYEAFLRYAQNLQNKTVLGIGEGQGLAFGEIAKAFSDQLRFTATVLNTPAGDNYRHLEAAVGKRNIHITSAEVLRGIEAKSISAVLAQFSLAYADPVLSTQRLDEVLEPGGVVKATFNLPEKTSGKGLRSPEEFTREWYRLGYDVFSMPILTEEQGPTGKPILPRTIVIAIKPSGVGNTIHADQLYEQDSSAFLARSLDKRDIGRQWSLGKIARLFTGRS